MAWWASSHYLDQCQDIVIWTLRKKTSVKFQSKLMPFHSRKCVGNFRLRNDGHVVTPRTLLTHGGPIMVQFTDVCMRHPASICSCCFSTLSNSFTRRAPITAKFSSVPVPRPVLSYPLVTTCYPRGAPAYACQYLYVKHNYILPQFSPTPYLVEVNNTEYSPGDLLSSECTTLQWRHNGHDGVWNDQPHHRLLNRLFRRTLKKHQSSASLAFVRGIHRSPVNSPHKWPVTRKVFAFDDVIMIVGIFTNIRDFAVTV